MFDLAGVSYPLDVVTKLLNGIRQRSYVTGNIIDKMHCGHAIRRRARRYVGLGNSVQGGYVSA